MTAKIEGAFLGGRKGTTKEGKQYMYCDFYVGDETLRIYGVDPVSRTQFKSYALNVDIRQGSNGKRYIDYMGE